MPDAGDDEIFSERNNDDDRVSEYNNDDSPTASAQKRAQQRAAAKAGSWSCSELLGLVVPEGFDQEGNGAPRHCAPALELTLETVESTLDETARDSRWREHEVFKPENIEAFATKLQRHASIFHGCKPLIVNGLLPRTPLLASAKA